jgi:hypothetical protein
MNFSIGYLMFFPIEFIFQFAIKVKNEHKYKHELVDNRDARMYRCVLINMYIDLNLILRLRSSLKKALLVYEIRSPTLASVPATFSVGF